MSTVKKLVFGVLAAALTLAGAAPANASHGNPATDVIAGTVTGNVQITSPNGIPGPAEQAEPTSYNFSGVVISGSIKSTDDVVATGTINVSGVTGSADAEKETASWGRVNSASSRANFNGGGLAVDTGLNVDPNGSIDGTFYGTFVRIATNVFVGLTADYTISYNTAGGPTESYSGGGTTAPAPVPVSVVAEFIPSNFNANGHPDAAVFAGSFTEPGQPVAA